jgi:hypothetical protein
LLVILLLLFVVVVAADDVKREKSNGIILKKEKRWEKLSGKVIKRHTKLTYKWFIFMVPSFPGVFLHSQKGNFVKKE